MNDVYRVDVQGKPERKNALDETDCIYAIIVGFSLELLTLPVARSMTKRLRSKLLKPDEEISEKIDSRESSSDNYETKKSFKKSTYEGGEKEGNSRK